MASRESCRWYGPISCSRSENRSTCWAHRSEVVINAGIFDSASEAPVLTPMTTFCKPGGHGGKPVESALADPVVVVCAFVAHALAVSGIFESWTIDSGLGTSWTRTAVIVLVGFESANSWPVKSGFVAVE